MNLRLRASTVLMMAFSVLTFSGSAGSSYTQTQSVKASRYVPGEGLMCRPPSADAKAINTTGDCFEMNVRDAMVNYDTPSTYQDLRDNHAGEYDKMSPAQSIWHNFKTDVDYSSPPALVLAMYEAWREYMGITASPPTMRPEDCKYLDPTFPNVKFVSKDGHKEVVYNKNTGVKIDQGINQGTANSATRALSIEHISDIVRYAMCGPPSELENEIGRQLAKDENKKIKEAVDSLFRRKQTKNENATVIGDTIDTSKLEALIKKMIAFAQSLLDAGEKATDDQLSTYNSYADEARRELARLLRPILALPVSDAEKQNIFKEKIEKKLKVFIERHQALQKQLVSRGVVGGLRPVSLDDLNLLGTKQSGSDGDKCVCPKPDYKATIPPAGPGWATCTKCGKSLGTILNGRIISTNPAVNGKPVK